MRISLALIICFQITLAQAAEQRHAMATSTRQAEIAGKKYIIPTPEDACYDADFDSIHKNAFSPPPFIHCISFLSKDEKARDFKPGYTLSYILPTVESGPITKAHFDDFKNMFPAFLQTGAPERIAANSLPPEYGMNDYFIEIAFETESSFCTLTSMQLVVGKVKFNAMSLDMYAYTFDTVVKYSLVDYANTPSSVLLKKIREWVQLVTAKNDTNE